MATKLVIDFDCNLVAGQSTAPTTWENCAKPVGVYAHDGVVTANPNIDNNPFGGFIGVGPGRDALSGAYGNASTSNVYTSGGSPQIGVKRSKYGIGAEIYATFDVSYVLSGSNTGTLSSLQNSGIFRWGDLTVRVYTVTYTPPAYTVVYRVYNGATVVATITVPDVTSSVWHYCKIRAKLDGTTGLIDVNIDGFSQSAAYVNQNTVGTIPLITGTTTTSSADHIYFGPPTYQYIGGFNSSRFGFIDNIWIGDTAFPAGRVNARRWPMGTTSTDSGWAAVGTSPTTIPDSLLLPTDAKAARGTGVGASTLITMASGFDFTDMQADLIGINVYLKRPAQLDAYSASRHIAVGLSISGTHYMDTVVAGEYLHVDNQLVPPNQNYTFGGLGGGIYNASLTQTNFPSTTIRLLVS